MTDRSRNGGRLGLCSFILICYTCLPICCPKLRAEAFVIVNLNQQARRSRPMKRINNEMERRHTSNICRMASAGDNNNSNDDKIDDLYRIVAEQDPEWFQDFVTNVLGEESVGEDILALSRASASREKTVQAMPKDVPSEKKPVYEQIPPEIKEDEPVVAAASATITEDVVPSANDDENEKLEKENLSAEEATDVGGEDILGDEVVVVSSGDTDEELDETVPLPVAEEEEVVAVSSSNTDEDLDETIPLPVAEEEEVVAVSSSNTDEDLDEPVPLPVSSEEEEKEAVAVSSSDTDEYLNETVLLPAAKEEVEEAVTSKGTVPENNESTLPDDDNMEASSSEEASSDRIILYKDAYSQSFVRIYLANVIALGYSEAEIGSLEADALDLIASDGIVKPRSGVPSRWKVKSGQPSQVRIMSKVQADQAVSDETEKKKQKKEGRRDKVIDVKESTAAETDTLGDELDPAVPLRKSSKEEQRVPVSRENESRRDGDRIRPPRSKAGTESARGERSPSTTRKSQTRSERDESPREKPPSSRRERPSKRSDRDEGRRRVYDGRPAPSSPKSKRKRDDPPSPNSPVWVDIDTFRGLLRSEAGLRLRILGDDWADTVKEESDWRLDLYKEWLWTLHNGVGKPIVESRSDRMRRKSGGKREDDKRDPPPRRPRKRRER
jgi:hypothetical protein